VRIIAIATTAVIRKDICFPKHRSGIVILQIAQAAVQRHMPELHQAGGGLTQLETWTNAQSLQVPPPELGYGAKIRLVHRGDLHEIHPLLVVGWYGG